MNAVLVTGSNGGIGTAICKYLKKLDYYVIGTDLYNDVNNLDAFVVCDISELAYDEKKYHELNKQLDTIIGKMNLVGLVNNAAIQVLGGVDKATIQDFKKSIDTNVVAPFALTKILKKRLSLTSGCVINIGSIHSTLTKPGFISYATSKSALLGLTKSLAVDCGERIRINYIQLAAIETDMLRDGFNNDEEKLDKLKTFHPTNTIGSPCEVASVVELLISREIPFANGGVFELSGGIGSRLHDPV